MAERQTVVITGAAGFIGSNLAHRLAADGHLLILVDDDLSRGKASNLANLHEFQFLNHRLLLDALAKPLSIKKPDVIFHLGACSSTTETNWDYLAENNLEYTKKLWQWCAEEKVPFIYASSAATYGDGSQGFDDHTDARELKPLNLYGKSKNDFDIWALAQCSAHATVPPTWAGMKFFNVYGPREGHKQKMASVVWQTFQQIRATGKMKLFKSTDLKFSDGGQLRDFVFVNDNIDHMLWIWKERPASAIYNSGTGNARTFLDLARATFAALNLEPVIEFIDMPTELAKQYQNYTQANMSKLRSAGYATPATTLEAGVKQTVDYLVQISGT